MKILDESTTDGVVARRFDLTVEDQTVPGMLWRPADTERSRATILVGHGGFQSKEAPNIVEFAAQLATERGYTTVALDAPGHGDRRTAEQIAQQEETLRRLRDGGVGGGGVGGGGAGAGAGAGAAQPRGSRRSGDEAPGDPTRLPRMVREWKALLDHLDGDDELGGGPYGYWGVSMGCRYGIPLAANEPRISAAVLGLFGLMPDPTFKAQVESISIPLLFLFQYHDELMTPEAGLALWAAFGSKDKTMHINPGPHVGIPKFERDASAAFYARHLG